MIPDFAQQLAALQRQNVAALRQRYAELFGEPTRAGNRAWLIKRIAWRLQAVAEGDLSERARQRAAELARDADLRLCAPRALFPTLVEVDLSKKGRSTRAHDSRLPPPGTLLRRRYKGMVLQVHLLPSGGWFGTRRPQASSTRTRSKGSTVFQCRRFCPFIDLSLGRRIPSTFAPKVP
jgi:hypothetical protein